MYIKSDLQVRIQGQLCPLLCIYIYFFLLSLTFAPSLILCMGFGEISIHSTRYNFHPKHPVFLSVYSILFFTQ